MQQWPHLPDLPDHVTAFGLVEEPEGWRHWQAGLDTMFLREISKMTTFDTQVFYILMGLAFTRDTR